MTGNSVERSICGQHEVKGDTHNMNINNGRFAASMLQCFKAYKSGSRSPIVAFLNTKESLDIEL